MNNFWDFNVWGTFNLFAVLFLSLLIGNMLKKEIPFLKKSLIPTSVIGGLLLISVAAVYKALTGEVMFDTAFFGSMYDAEGNLLGGTAKLEIITYHALALGFIASSLKTTKAKVSKQRTGEILNTGVTTVATYLLQGILGLGITILCALAIPGFFKAAGVLLPFGFGQGSGQAMNYGIIYESMGFTGGKSFGLTIAALGFLAAAIGGVIHLNIMKHKGVIKIVDADSFRTNENVDPQNEIPLSENIDKMTVQVTLIAVTYFLAYELMSLLGNVILPSMKSVVFGFNFLIGVLCAILLKQIIRLLKRTHIINKDYTNNFLMTRASNFCFDVMIVAGIAAIRLDILENYWSILAVIAIVGTVFTYAYNYFVAKKLFSGYAQEQFLAMYGMLTGTASTGIILLREIDGEFKTPAADNLVYQNLPAIVFGFPMMLLATLAPEKPILTLIIFIVFFAAMNIILFRKQLFRRKAKTPTAEAVADKAEESHE